MRMNMSVIANRILCACAACLMTITLSACSGGNSGSSEPAANNNQQESRSARPTPAIGGRGDKAAQYEMLTSGGSFHVVVTPNKKIRANTPVDLKVKVTTGTNREDILSDAELSFSASMTEEGGGLDQQPQISQNSDGTFTVSGVTLPKAGMWDLNFEITQGGTTESARTSMNIM